ncbi:MAG: DUF4920 domain-containing protein [Chitinophagales bacterium]
MMKKIFYVLIFISMMVACESTTKNLGEQFTVQQPVSVDEVLAQLQSNNSLKDIQIEGTIEKSCMSEGCWFTIKDTSGTEILFNVKDKKFKVPTNSPGKVAIMLADAARDTTSEQKVDLEVKGLMFK